MRYTHTEKPNIALRLAALLLCLTLFSLYLLSGLYARYTVTGTAADSARVAAFQPTATITPATETVEYVYDYTGGVYLAKYTITITNPSEVAVDCKLNITKDDKLAEQEGSIWFVLYDPVLKTKTPMPPDHFVDPVNWHVLQPVSLGVLDAQDLTGITKVIWIEIHQDVFNTWIADSNFETGKLDLTQYFTASVTFTQVD